MFLCPPVFLKVFIGLYNSVFLIGNCFAPWTVCPCYSGKPKTNIFLMVRPPRGGGGGKGRTTKKKYLFFPIDNNTYFTFNDFTTLLNYVVGWRSLSRFVAKFGKNMTLLSQTFWGEYF